jgi:hypothetical protein
MKKKTKKVVKAWLLLAKGLDTVQMVYLSRGEAALGKKERAGIYATYIKSGVITYNL